MSRKTLKFGRIVWAERPDPSGRNSKRRPWVVITPPDQLIEGKPILAVAISTLSDESNEEYRIELPWGQGQLNGTKLMRWSAAVCTWIAEIQFDELSENDSGGVVPLRTLQLIVNKVAELQAL